MAESSANLDLTREMLDRWNAGDRESILEVVDPETELDSRLGSLRGEPWHQETSWVLRLRERRLVRMEIYTDRAEALRAAGIDG
jgi:ketosteroid isomerase-like protein